MASVGDLSDAQGRVTESLIERLIRWLFNLWESNTDWSDEGSSRVVDESVEAVLDHVVEARRLTDAYLSEVFSGIGESLPRDLPDSRFESYPRESVTAWDVWERPVREYRAARANGDSLKQAKLKMLKRVRQLADSDIRFAQRERAARIYSKSGFVKGYRRIIHPELSRTGVCGLCVVAADRVYSASYLYPLHDNCKCETLPVTIDHDPGLSLNREDLDRIYDAAGGKGASRLSQVRVKEYVSGELGPVLSKEVAYASDGLSDRNRAYSVSGGLGDARSHVRSDAGEASKAAWTIDRLKNRPGSSSRALRDAEKAKRYWDRRSRRSG